MSKKNILITGAPGVGETTGSIILIDEIGKMECFSERFKEVLLRCLNSEKKVIATIALKGSEWIEEIKKIFFVNRRGRGGGHQDFREDRVPSLQIDSFPSQGHIHNPNTPGSWLLFARRLDKGSQSS